MKIVSQIKKHAMESFPEECLGYVSEGVYHRLVNMSKDPTKRYSLSLDDRFLIFDLDKKKELTALVHSHPTLDNRMSGMDKEAQRGTGFNFYII